MLTIILSIFLGCSLYFNIEGLFLLRKQDEIIRELSQEKDELINQKQQLNQGGKKYENWK